jgi:hypothetical protein
LIIIGDTLSISEEQAKEHHLTKVDDIKDPLIGKIFEIFETKPKR